MIYALEILRYSSNNLTTIQESCVFNKSTSGLPWIPYQIGKLTYEN